VSIKARRLLVRAIKIYREEDGASEPGAYRDAITDLLHLATEDKQLLKDNPGYPSRGYVRNLQDEAYSAYMEERESNEYKRMMQIPDKELPLHINESWEFDTVTQEFWKRLKGTESCSLKDTSTESSSAF
jgi:hypothetical protein